MNEAIFMGTTSWRAKGAQIGRWRIVLKIVVPQGIPIVLVL